MPVVYVCRICEKDFDEIPETAIRLGSNGAYKLHRFSNGEIHDLRKIEAGPPIKSGTIPEPKPVVAVKIEPVKPTVPAPEPVEEVQTEPEEFWTSEYEARWWTAYVVRFDMHYLLARLEGASGSDYTVYCHNSTFADGFGRAAIGTKIRLRLTPNRKEGSNFVWESLEATIE